MQRRVWRNGVLTWMFSAIDPHVYLVARYRHLPIAVLHFHLAVFPPIRRHSDQDQERVRLHPYFPAIVPRRYLRIMRHEHRRCQYTCLPLSYSQGHEQDGQDLPSSAQCVFFLTRHNVVVLPNIADISFSLRCEGSCAGPHPVLVGSVVGER